VNWRFGRWLIVIIEFVVALIGTGGVVRRSGGERGGAVIHDFLVRRG
jgi:hypothetical protein